MTNVVEKSESEKSNSESVEALRQRAHAFLIGLQDALSDHLPQPALMRESIRRIIAESKSDDTKKHLGQPEYVFLNHYVIPTLFDFVQDVHGIDADQARKSLLCEFYRHMPQYCLTTAARTVQSPFVKRNLEADASEVMREWREGKIERACPDFALADPFPYRVVFEGKYFEKGSAQKAAVELVSNIRQAFFYRSFPPLPSQPGRREWNYDFSCLIACDASEEGSLRAAWDELPENVKAAFWGGANLYVMIIRPRGTSA